MFVLGMNLRTYPFDIVVHFYVILIVCRFVSQIDNDENRGIGYDMLPCVHQPFLNIIVTHVQQ